MANDDTRAAPLVCAHALDTAGALPDPATIAGCPICWRRWRLAEARLRGWLPLDAATARPLLDRMAAEAAAGVDADPALSEGFYAFLAGSPDDEADFTAACVVAFAPHNAEPSRRPPADFGWRALFADLPLHPPDPAPPAPAATFTRVWQWRESAASDTTPRRETRAFVRGESPPPFAPLPAGSAARWVRERGVRDGGVLFSCTATDAADRRATRAAPHGDGERRGESHVAATRRGGRGSGGGAPVRRRGAGCGGTVVARHPFLCGGGDDPARASGQPRLHTGVRYRLVS